MNMAPRFKYNIYKIYDDGFCAAICFTQDSLSKIFDLREHLTDAILCKSNVFVYKDKGSPTPVDSWYQFFNLSEKEIVETFYKNKGPGFLSMILNLKKYKLWHIDQLIILGKMLFDLRTSHDYPCLVIDKNEILSKDELISLINEQTKKMNLNFSYDDGLPDMNSFMISNRKFGF